MVIRVGNSEDYPPVELPEWVEHCYPAYMTPEEERDWKDFAEVETLTQDTSFGKAECGCRFILPADDEGIIWYKCAAHKVG